MTENIKLTAYLNLIHETEQETANIPHVNRLSGLFAQAVLQAMMTDLSHEEMHAAIAIGHHRGCQQESLRPDYSFLLAQLTYWEAVYEDAEQFWFCRHRTDDGA